MSAYHFYRQSFSPIIMDSQPCLLGTCFHISSSFIMNKEDFVKLFLTIGSSVGAAVGGWIGAWAAVNMWNKWNPPQITSSLPPIGSLPNILQQTYGFTQEVCLFSSHSII